MTEMHLLLPQVYQSLVPPISTIIPSSTSPPQPFCSINTANIALIERPTKIFEL